MGAHIHVLEDVKGIKTCSNCHVPAVMKRGRYYCPVSWRQGHGQKRVSMETLARAERQGLEIRRTKSRTSHFLEPGEKRGTLVCVQCSLTARKLPNGSFICPTLYDQALRHMAIYQERGNGYGPPADIVVEPTAVDTVVEGDDYVPVTTKTRQYKSLSGRLRGGDAAVPEELE